jgi:aryl-alcohol dehydrogenase-like predicted oxidoreductase
VSAIQLTPIIFGAMGLPNLTAPLRTRLIHGAIEQGVTSFDTAPLYGAGESERILGRALAGRRHHVQILTKCGIRWDSDHGQPMFQMVVDGRMRLVRKDSRPAGIREGLEASLRHLDTDFIDVYQVHHYDALTPLEAAMEELERALTAGKIRAIGISNYQVPELERAHAALRRGLFSTQTALSLLQIENARSVLAAARAKGMAFLAHEPLAQGILAGKYLSYAPNDPRAPRGIGPINDVLRDVVAPMAQERGLTLAQVALGWLLAQPGVTAAIAGASSEKQLAENAAAAHVRLEPTLLASLSVAFAACKLERDVPPTFAQRVGRRLTRLTQGARWRLAAWLR